VQSSVHTFVYLTKDNTERLNYDFTSGTSDALSTDSITSEDAVILHYPCCGFEHFWSKYVSRGHFEDKWLDRVEIAPFIPFHIEARNTVMRGGREEAQELYRRRVVISDQTIIDRLIKSELACRIVNPARQLEQMSRMALGESKTLSLAGA
jgi:hypothetical protein